MLGERIPLRRVKTMRKTLSEKNMLNNFLKEHAYRLSQISFRGSNLTTLPLRNIMDVSILGGWCPTEPSWCSSLALGLFWRCLVGCWFGVPAGGRRTGKQGPHPEEKALSPQLLVFVTGPSNYQVAGKHPFLCQRCVISLRVIIASKVSHSVIDE